MTIALLVAILVLVGCTAALASRLVMVADELVADLRQARVDLGNMNRPLAETLKMAEETRKLILEIHKTQDEVRKVKEDEQVLYQSNISAVSRTARARAAIAELEKASAG